MALGETGCLGDSGDLSGFIRGGKRRILRGRPGRHPWSNFAAALTLR
jgi:hypothetical protein